MKRRSVKIALLILAVFLGYVWYTLQSAGFFRTVENHFEGSVLKQVPLQGAEDITISHTDNFALVSSTKRNIYPPTEEESGGLYKLDLQNNSFTTIHLSRSFSQPFAPHGISMFKKDGAYTILAVNHTKNGHSIEKFRLIGDSLIFDKTYSHPSMISPNDVVLIDQNRFYFTNDHGYTKGMGKFFEEYLGLSVSNVVYFDGTDFIEVADGIAYANGINFDPSKNLLYVASPRGFEIKVYSRNQDGTLTFTEDIPCGTGVDNVEIDPKGNLWTAGHPNLLRFKAYAKGNKNTAPSEIIKVTYRKKGDYTTESIFVDKGDLMSGSSVATPFRDMILTGNVMDNKFLILKN